MPARRSGGDGSGPGRRGRKGGRSRKRAAFQLERELWRQGREHVAGVDEVGRGPLAGPVFAAAVILPAGVFIRGVDDSKLMTAEARESAAERIRRRAIAIGLGAASCREIDRLNILRASHLAMQRALARLRVRPDHVVVDGLPVPGLDTEHTAVVDGDQRVHCVACASILAKVSRDHLMRRLSRHYPGYGWDHNVGYSTPEHKDALVRLGPTPHHRRSFIPVQLALDLDA
jgi:ribonuclease HII